MTSNADPQAAKIRLQRLRGFWRNRPLGEAGVEMVFKGLFEIKGFAQLR